MSKQYRSYSDHEIANFVLGIEMPENTTRGIQHNLANDNAAAARALKWEAYFLSLVDGLQPVKPQDSALETIQNTLGIKIISADIPDETNIENNPDPTDQTTIGSEIKSKKKTRKGKFKTAIMVLILLIVGFIAWASLKAPAESSITQQTIDLNK